MLDDPCISDLPLPLEEPAMATGEQGTQETLATMPSSPLWAFQLSQALAARCMNPNPNPSPSPSPSPSLPLTLALALAQALTLNLTLTLTLTVTLILTQP